VTEHQPSVWHVLWHNTHLLKVLNLSSVIATAVQFFRPRWLSIVKLVVVVCFSVHAVIQKKTIGP